MVSTALPLPNSGTTNTFTSTNTIQTTSTNAFKVQNASSLAVLTADTSGNQLQIGGATTDANAIPARS